MVYIIPFPLDVILVLLPSMLRGIIIHMRWKKYKKKHRITMYEYKYGPEAVNYKKKEFWTVQVLWAIAMIIPVSR